MKETLIVWKAKNIFGKFNFRTVIGFCIVPNTFLRSLHYDVLSFLYIGVAVTRS
jgi:hypothetical protein